MEKSNSAEPKETTRQPWHGPDEVWGGDDHVDPKIIRFALSSVGTEAYLVGLNDKELAAAWLAPRSPCASS